MSDRTQGAGQLIPSEAGKLHIFISYSRDDIAFSDQLDAALDAFGFSTTLDRHSIAGGEDWKVRLGNLICDADTVVFVLSPSSAHSEMCDWEVEEALRLGKRVIPVLCRPLEGASPPSQLTDRNYTFFYSEPKSPGSGFGDGLARLVSALNSDLDWLREHTRLLQRASEWDAAGRAESRLLFGDSIAAAKGWAACKPKGAPEPIALVYEFIRVGEEAEARRQNVERQQIQQMAALQAVQSKTLAEKEEALAEKEEAQRGKAEQARRVVRRTLMGLAAAILLASLASGAGLFAFKKQREAVAAQRTAESATIVRRISQAETEFKISPTRGLLLAVEALNLSRRDQVNACIHQVTCVRYAADALEKLLSATGGTPLIGRQGYISSVSFSADGRFLATAGSNTVNLWRLDQLGKSFATLPLPYSGGRTAMSFSRDGKLLATAAFGTVLIWRVEEPQSQPRRFPIEPFSNMEFTSASFSSNGKFVFTANASKIRVWQLNQLETPDYVPAEFDTGRIIAAAFISDDESILTASDAGQVLQWRADQLSHNYKSVLVQDLKAPIETVSFSSDGKLLVIPRQLELDTKSLQNTARLINFSDPATWVDSPPESKKQVVRAAALSDDGKQLATAEDDGTVRIWRVDVQPPTEYLELRGHQGPVTAASFSPDGKFIATGGSDTTTRLWQLDRPMAIASPDNSVDRTNRIDELTLLARKTAGRNFTSEEWSSLFPDEKYHPTFPDLPSTDIGRDE